MVQPTESEALAGIEETWTSVSLTFRQRSKTREDIGASHRPDHELVHALLGELESSWT
jgi:hypothetical protein